MILLISVKMIHVAFEYDVGLGYGWFSSFCYTSSK
jgi:hypothetical protein